jgi:hypothetical protein
LLFAELDSESKSGFGCLLARAFVLNRLWVPLSRDQSPPVPLWCFANRVEFDRAISISLRHQLLENGGGGYAEEEDRE